MQPVQVYLGPSDQFTEYQAPKCPTYNICPRSSLCTRKENFKNPIPIKPKAPFQFLTFTKHVPYIFHLRVESLTNILGIVSMKA
jgi:hypothetical protein